MAEKSEHKHSLFISFWIVNILALLLHSLHRLLALAWNWSSFKGISAHQLIVTLLTGIRYDAFSVTWLALFPAFVALILSPFVKRSDRWMVGLVGIVQLLGLWINLVDIEMIRVVGRRFEIGDRFLFRESSNIFTRLFLHYWFLTVVGLAFAAAFYLVCLPLGKATFAKIGPYFSSRPILKWGLGTLGSLFLLIVGSRGGLQPKPLDFAHANFSQSIPLNAIAMNSVFTIYQSTTKTQFPPNKFIEESEVAGLVEGTQTPKSAMDGLRPKEPQNVVILIVESLSLEHMGSPFHDKGYTPFLDELSEHALFFPKGIANARRSIDGVCAVLTGIPAWSDESFISSSAMNSDFGGIANLLKPEGYYSAFFHGGNNGTMFFDSFALRAGFDDYFGANEFGDSSKSDGTWGIYDDPFLQYTAQKMSSFRTPFLTSIFTLSSHGPYKIPDQYRHRFPKGNLAIHESVGYADYAIRHFFETAQKQSWYKNTLFIITADHTFFDRTRPEFLNEVGNARIPLIFFHPNVDLPKLNTAQFVQQIDIVPSILDYLGFSKDRHVLLGKSVFAEGPRYAIYAANESHYWLFQDEKFVHYLRGGASHLFDWKDPAEGHELTKDTALNLKLTKQMQASLQYLSYGILNSKLLSSPTDEQKTIRGLAHE